MSFGNTFFISSNRSLTASEVATVFVPEVDAAVAWYGFPPLEYIDASKITAPLMGHFATRDGFFKIDKYNVRHELFSGAMGNAQTIEVFERGDAVAALLFVVAWWLLSPSAADYKREPPMPPGAGAAGS